MADKLFQALFGLLGWQLVLLLLHFLLELRLFLLLGLFLVLLTAFFSHRGPPFVVCYQAGY